MTRKSMLSGVTAIIIAAVIVVIVFIVAAVLFTDVTALIISVVGSIAGIALRVCLPFFFDIEEDEEDQEVTDKLLLLLPVAVPTLATLISGWLMYASGQKTMTFVFCIISLGNLLFMLYSMKSKKEANWKILLVAIINMVGIAPNILVVVAAMRIMTILVTLLAFMMFSGTLFMTARKQFVKLLFSLTAGLLLLFFAVIPRGFEDMANPQREVEEVTEAMSNIEQVASDVVVDVNEKISQVTATPTPTATPSYVFDGVIDTEEELVKETNIKDVAKENGLDNWVYRCPDEDGNQYVWAKDTLFKFYPAEGKLESVATEVPENTCVAGGNFYYLNKRLELLKNGTEVVVDSVWKIEQVGTEVHYHVGSNEYTIY